jgi:hypothetical protein
LIRIAYKEMTEEEDEASLAVLKEQLKCQLEQVVFTILFNLLSLLVIYEMIYRKPNNFTLHTLHLHHIQIRFFRQIHLTPKISSLSCL